AGLFDSGLELGLSLARSGLRRSQQFMRPTRRRFDLASLRQLVTGDRSVAHDEKITRIIPQRVLQQQGVRIKRLLLNLFQIQRLGLGQSGVPWTALPDLGPDLFILVR